MDKTYPPGHPLALMPIQWEKLFPSLGEQKKPMPPGNIPSPTLLVEPMTEKIDWSQGQKFDQAKPRMDLLDPDFLEHVAQVLTFGAKKYDAHNWRNGINVSRLVAASYRHLGAISRGEDVDPESGLPHTAHLGCCVMFLDWMLANRKDLDDRWKNSTTEGN